MVAAAALAALAAAAVVGVVLRRPPPAEAGDVGLACVNACPSFAPSSLSYACGFGEERCGGRRRRVGRGALSGWDDSSFVSGG